MKKKFCIYGNCQVYSLKACLEQNQDFQAAYENIPLKPVFELSKSDVFYLEEVISEVDLFIHQPISDNYKGIEQFGTEYLKKSLKHGSQAISFPVAYFTGYHPEMFYLKDENGSVLDKPLPYHDTNILLLYMKKLRCEDVLKLIYNPDFYTPEYLEKNMNQTLENLSNREKLIDIKISQFIRDNYKRRKLFHTINHPHISIIKFIAQTILTHLDCVKTEIDISQIPNMFYGENTDYPIYPSVISGLNLDFTSKLEYRIKGKSFTSQEIVKILFDFYEQNSNLVEKAQKRIVEKNLILA